LTIDSGFDEAFLPGHQVALPTPATDAVRTDIKPTRDGHGVRHCTHFSLSMSASRRLCRWVAWNIDGATAVPTTGDGRDFRIDHGYDTGAQLDNDLYTNNHLDRGHIAAFANVSWGPAEEAERARYQSCFWTNITPQLDAFNQSGLEGLWGLLENSLRDENDVDELRLSVFGGPILGPDDVPYADALVPRDFWKVVGYVEKGTLKAKGYIVTQENLDGGISLGLEEYAVYQHRIAELGEKLGLDLGALVAADTAPPSEPGLAPTPVARRITCETEISVDGW
jgi:endonuclease G